MEGVRNALGDDIEICFDVHTRLDIPDALYFCKETEQYRPYFIEDPLRSEAPEAFAQLRGRTVVPTRSRGAVHVEVSISGIDRERLDRLLPDRSLPRRRNYRSAQGGRLVRSALHQDGGSQSARPGFECGLPAVQSGHLEFRCPGTATQAESRSFPTSRRCSRFGKTAISCLQPRQDSVSRSTVKRRRSIRSRWQAAATAPAGWLVHELVTDIQDIRRPTYHKERESVEGMPAVKG